MRHRMSRAAMVCAFALVPPLAFAQPEVGGARFQYDDLRVWLAAGQPAPSPDAFEQQYAAALDHFAHSRSLTELKTDAVAKREAAMKALAAPGMGAHIADMLMGQITGLISQANPIAGMVFGMILGAAKGHGPDQARLEDTAQAAEGEFRHEEASRPGLRRISVWDHWLRVDDLDDGSAVIVKPDRNEYFLLDTRQKTWVRLPEAPLTDTARRVRDDPRRCDYPDPIQQATPLPARELDGHAASGWRSSERMQVSPDQVMVTENTFYMADQRIPDDILGALNGIPTCPPGSAARKTSVPDDRVTLYQAMATHWENAHGQRIAFGQGDTDPVHFEQHLRPLAVGDRDALFEIPADYRELR
ncbi:MAG: hypothetical protein JSR56_02645 [Proteobacteria bacterium]|nr:hypothetical protein [Pseudomonadota bacterium]